MLTVTATTNRRTMLLLLVSDGHIAFVVCTRDASTTSPLRWGDRRSAIESSAHLCVKTEQSSPKNFTDAPPSAVSARSPQTSPLPTTTPSFTCFNSDSNRGTSRPSPQADELCIRRRIKAPRSLSRCRPLPLKRSPS